VTVAIIIAVAALLVVVEYARPGRRWPKVAGWWPRALALNACQVGAVFLAGATWERWLHGPHLFALSRLPLVPQLAVAYAVNVLWLYWFHRARHRIGPLWRWLHQVHHSPQRIEILTAFYKHPLEIVVESVLASVVFYGVLGASPLAAFIASTTSGVLGLFYHWNISTPRWLGYVVQRPESHCVHHERGVHAFNYSELPIVDLVFGTLRNPPRFEGACGFEPGREQRVTALLLGRDVNAE
jgi:sterol desaturase/sphingolipid hydroxylase (fatty acid hydroxylase superfamily)